MDFQAAAAEIWAATRIQRCWFHKSVNILGKLSSSIQAKAKGMIHDMYFAPTREDAVDGDELFIVYRGDK